MYQEIFQKLDFILENKNSFEEDNNTELFNSVSSSLAIKIKDLDQKIFDFEKRSKGIADQIELFEDSIEYLREKNQKKNDK